LKAFGEKMEKQIRHQKEMEKISALTKESVEKKNIE